MKMIKNKILGAIRMTDIQARIKEYREYKRMIEELEALTDSIADELKTMMTEAGQERMVVGEYKLSYTDVTRRDIDKKRLESEHKALYDAYQKESTYKRFLVS
jgi:predicted phage-related endonuclease